jgi:hypothetical protein
VSPKSKKPSAEENGETALEALAHEILKSPGFRGAPYLAGMFGLLWRNRKRKEPTTGQEFWVKVWKEAANKYAPLGPSEACIRTVRTELGKKLEDYCRANQTEWIIRILPGGPERGYRLDCIKRDDPTSPAQLFWKAHLDWHRDISLAYAEQLFYLNPADGYLFRFYDCNADQEPAARNELREKHPRFYNDSIRCFHPYVARGEMEAKELIRRWFSAVFRKVKAVVTHYQPADAAIWQDSLILLGSAASNRFVDEALQASQGLPIHLRDRLQVSVAAPTSPEEYGWLQRQSGALRYELSGDTEHSLSLHFQTDVWVPVILTRIPNPHATRACVTIFNSEYGRAIEELAKALTEQEHRLQQGIEFFNIRPPYPASFQCLCAVSIREQTGYHIRPLLWRACSSPGF